MTSVTIPDGAESIGSSAFKNCTSLESIIIPDSVESIGIAAFNNCINLDFNTSTDENDNAYYLGNGLHPYLWLIKAKSNDITICNINENCKFIYSSAFSSCGKLENVTIPDGVTLIGSSAFSSCTSLKNITMGKNVTTIGSSAFFNCTSIETITIPDAVTLIGGSAFKQCTKLKRITIPKSVTSIGLYAFENCSSLTSITFENVNNWYVVDTYEQWAIKTNGEEIDVSDSSQNATNFKTTYCNYGWYKK